MYLSIRAQIPVLIFNNTSCEVLKLVRKFKNNNKSNLGDDNNIIIFYRENEQLTGVWPRRCPETEGRLFLRFANFCQYSQVYTEL